MSEFLFKDIVKLIKIITNLSKKEMTKLRVDMLIYFIYAYLLTKFTYSGIVYI